MALNKCKYSTYKAVSKAGLYTYNYMHIYHSQAASMQALDTVVSLIHEWQPDRLPKELKYRDSLASFLRERLPQAIVEKEYRHSGTTSDLYVECNGFLRSSEVFIELKRDLQQKNQLDRLVGQLESLKPGKHRIIVVLCGETKPELLTRLRLQYSNHAQDYFRLKMMAIVVKAVAARAPR